MFTNNNQSITQKIKKIFGLSELTGYPRKLGETIVPVAEVNAISCNVLEQGFASNATSSTAYTTPTEQDFYLVGGTISVIKDASSESTYTGIELTPFGQNSKEVFKIATITLTAQTETMNFTLPYPLKLARGTTVKIVNSSGVANIRAGVTIYGYTSEDIGN